MEFYRADQLGSFLLPAEVKEARGAFQQSRINQTQLAKDEDEAILAVLEWRKQVRVDVIGRWTP